jgi:hypothetical protein
VTGRSIIGIKAIGAQTHGANGGVADSLDEAKAAFRAAWERPLSEREAEEICSI